MATVETELESILTPAISVITLRGVFKRLGPLASLPLERTSPADRVSILAELDRALRLFAPGRAQELVAACNRTLERAPRSPEAGGKKRIQITAEDDIATARIEAWSEAVAVGLSKFAAVKIATVVSELARNQVFYAGRGVIELRAERNSHETLLELTARDQGPGIETSRLEEIDAGTYRSTRGMGKGLAAVRKLADNFHLETGPGRGTTVSCRFRETLK